MSALRVVAPNAGSYVSESDFFLRNWQRGFWGSHYKRLAKAKHRYDPEGLFVVHHGVEAKPGVAMDSCLLPMLKSLLERNPRADSVSPRNVT